MDKFSKLLKYIRRTNPEMTMDKLIEELSVCQYSAIVLNMICENDKKSAYVE